MHLEKFNNYLTPTFYLDSDSSIVQDFVMSKTEKSNSDIDRAIALYYAIRDGILYDPYRIDLTKNSFKASSIILLKKGFCVSKAVALAACSRAAGIPSRLHFADIKNHLTTKRLYELMKSDVFIFHAYTELYLEGKWIKATPAFNLSLCNMLGVMPLEFDGRSDSLFQQFDRDGKKFMEYLNDRGVYNDLPYDEIVKEFIKYYQELLSTDIETIEGDFEKE